MIDALLDDFLARAALAGVGVAAIAGPLGCFVIWRRMAYFGDALAHAALLGVALGLALQAPLLPSVMLFSLVLAALLALASQRSGLSLDSALGVLSHATLALGVLVVSVLPGVRVDLISYLFGDILAVSRGDLVLIWGGALLLGALLAYRWRALLNATLSEPLSRAEGGAPGRERLLLMLMLAALVALSMQVVGLLLVSALLILPAAAARPLSATPTQMALTAAALGALGASGGLGAAFVADSPAGPTIVTTLFVFFLLAQGGAALRGLLRRR